MNGKITIAIGTILIASVLAVGGTVASNPGEVTPPINGTPTATFTEKPMEELGEDFVFGMQRAVEQSEAVKEAAEEASQTDPAGFAEGVHEATKESDRIRKAAEESAVD